jgi:hypothetical protein
MVNLFDITVTVFLCLYVFPVVVLALVLFICPRGPLQISAAAPDVPAGVSQSVFINDLPAGVASDLPTAQPLQFPAPAVSDPAASLPASSPSPLPPAVQPGFVAYSLDLSGSRGRVAAAFKAAAASVRQAGFQVRPSATLREDFQALGPLPAAVESQFAELVSLTETSLYSTVEPDAALVSRAEALSDSILHHRQ